MATPPIEILLIQENEAEALRLRRWLSEDGLGPCRLNYAYSLEAALKRLSHGEVDVILLDAALPGGGGMQGVLRLRQAAAGVPVIILIGPQEREFVKEAAERGDLDCLVKDRLDGLTLTSTVRCAVQRIRWAAGRRPRQSRGWSWMKEHAGCHHGLSDPIHAV